MCAAPPSHAPSLPKLLAPLLSGPGVLRAPVVATEDAVRHSILALAGVSASDVFVDLGCGEGGVLVYAARYSGASCVGFDVLPRCVSATQRAADKAGVRGLVTAFCADFFDQERLTAHPSFAAATVVYMYLMPDVVRELEPLLRRAVDEGKVVLIYCSSGSRIRAVGARPAGNTIGEMCPVGTALMGKLRLYCSAEVLARRDEMRLACIPSGPLPRGSLNRACVECGARDLP